MKAVLAIIATCCLSFTIHATPITITVPDSTAIDLTEKEYRLDGFIKPTNYKVDLKLENDFHTKKKFTVNCDITFKVDDDAAPVGKKKVMRIHYALDKIVEGVLSLLDKDNKRILGRMTALNIVTEIAEITFDEDLVQARGPYILTFTSLTGTLRENMSGFYLSDYVHEGVKKYVATTQFQSTDARAAFPCFDEPSFKATFDISITRPIAYTTVLGNTKQKADDVVVGDFATTTFVTTPPMSTYLVAFIVSTFESTNPKSIFVPEGLVASASYAESTTPKILKNLGEELKMLYPALGNDQLYQAALPDFSAGAMENWGLVTYRETALLWDKDESSERNKQRVCSVVAHELSHMWFGNYVTLGWWSDTWLNEGFARYFEYHTTHNVEPTFEMDNQFVVDQQQVVFIADAVSSVAPLSSKEADIYTHAQIESKFNSISYNKGGSVLRMVERAMGKDKFLDALYAYLQANANENTNADKLIKVFESKGLKAGVMNQWVKAGGYPMVTVTRAENDILLKQKRFLLEGKDEPKMKWTIPITYANKNTNSEYKETLPQLWMEADATEDTKIVDGFKDTEIIILNVQASGYYRVNYEKELLEKIITKLRTEKKDDIPVISRAILIDDVMNIARAGEQNYDLALDLTKYLNNEVEYYPWVAAFNSFAHLRKRLVVKEAVDWLKNYVKRMSEKLYASVSFDIKEKDTHIHILKTALALQWACDLGVESCITKSKALFATYVAAKEAEKNPINPNLRGVVYCNGIREGAKTEWDFLHGKFDLPATPASEKVAIIAALGCSKTDTILKAFLEESLDSAKIRKQDAYAVFTSVVNGNPGNINVAYQFMVDNFATIPEKYANKMALINIFNLLADRFTTTKQITDFKAFITENAVALGDAKAAGDNAATTATANLEWTTKVQETIRSWLGREKNAAPTITASVLVVAMALVVTFFH